MHVVDLLSDAREGEEGSECLEPEAREEPRAPEAKDAASEVLSFDSEARLRAVECKPGGYRRCCRREGRYSKEQQLLVTARKLALSRRLLSLLQYIYLLIFI